MFTLRNPNLILLLAESLNSDLFFKDNSPLAKLVNTNCLEAEDLPTLLAKFEKDEAHEAFMGQMEQELTNLLRERIRFIRNDITSTIETICGKVGEKLDGMTATLPVQNIVTAYTPRLLESELLVGLVDKYKNVPISEAKIPAGAFPELSPAELVGIATSIDDGEVKEMISEVIDGMEVSIVDIYNRHFRGVKTPNYPGGFTYMRPSYTQFLYMEQVVVFMLADGFYKEAHGSVDMPLSAYNAAMATLRAKFGRLIYNGMGVIKHAEKVDPKLLVTTDLRDGKRVLVVNRKRYDWFLELEGVRPETVLGLDKNGKLGTIKLPTKESAMEYIGLIEPANLTIQRELNYMQSVIKDQRRTVVVKEVMKLVAEIAQSEKYVVPAGTSASKIIDECRKLAGEYGVVSLDKVYYFVRHLVCRGLYPESGAETYLSAMDRYQQENPNITAREAATLATRDTTLAWTCNQLK